MFTMESYNEFLRALLLGVLLGGGLSMFGNLWVDALVNGASLTQIHPLEDLRFLFMTGFVIWCGIIIMIWKMVYPKA